MADKILNSFDVWIAAQGWKSKLRLKSIDNISLEGIARLRELILELAIFGKLIPQDSSDEDANVLVRKITIERERLIEDGELKKQKLLPEITDDEKHFELPKGWTWVKLGNIGETNIGLTYSPKDVSDRGMPVLRSSNVQNGEISLDDLVRVSSKVDSKNFVENGDLLIYARNGSKKLVGKCAIIKDLKERMSFGAFMAIFRSPLNFYIKYFLESPFYRNRLEGVSTTTINQITQDNLKNTVIPLPPLSEQHRIVAKVDELMALCDELEQQETNHLRSHQLLVETLLGILTQSKDATEFQTAWATLAQHFDDLFIIEDSIDQLKQTILQLAVMGKLVKQDPKDEPASELLRELIKEREKDLPRLSDKEIHLRFPKSWILCRLGHVFTATQGVQISMAEQKEKPEGGYRKYLYISDFKDTGTPKYVKDIYPHKVINFNDLVMINTGATAGEVLTGQEGVLSNNLFKIDFPEEIDRGYAVWFFKSPFFHGIVSKTLKGGANPHMGHKRFYEWVFPLPPHAEQLRIVDKVDELFALCDRLKERIGESQKVVNLMAEAVQVV